MHEPRDEKLDHLGRDEERDGDQRVQQLKVAHKREEALHEARVAELDIEVHWVFAVALARRLAVPVAAQDGDAQREDELRNEDLDREEIHHALHVALLVAAQLAVHHDARFASSVHNEAQHPLSVLQVCALEQKLLMTEGEVAFLADVQVAVKLVQITVRGLSVDLGCHENVSWVEIDGARGDELVKVFGRSLDFEVFLTVERAGLNIAGCIGSTGGHEDHVSRELLVRAYENHVAHFDVLRSPHPQFATLYEHDLLLVGIDITFVALVIFKALSCHGDTQDESKWRVSCDWIHR